MLFLAPACRREVPPEPDDTPADTAPDTAPDTATTAPPSTADTGVPPPSPTARWAGAADLPAGLTLSGVASYDYVGYLVDVGGDATGDLQPDLLVASTAQSGGAASSGTVYLVAGPVVGDTSLADTIRLFGRQEPGQAGPAAAFLGDVDGDGHGDLVVGEPGNAGVVWVLHGPVAASGPLASVGLGWTGEVSGDGAGIHVGAPGDVTGDDLPDVLVGAYHSAAGAPGGGAAYVIAGPANSAGSLSGAAARIVGDAGDLYLGSAVAGVGDLDGDGVGDLAIGTDTAGAAETGGVYVFLGPVTGEIPASAARARLYGHAAWNHPGRFRGTIAGADLDGDGHQDLAIGDHRDGVDGTELRGGVYAVDGPSAVGEVDLGGALGILTGADPGDVAGATVSAIGDTDDDGNAEILVGSAGAGQNGFGSGSTSLVYGPLSGTASLGDRADAVWHGGTPNVWVGYGAAGGADLTGDGLADLALGARGADGDVASSGAVYLIPGSPP